MNYMQLTPLLDVLAEMILDPRARKAQPFGQFREDLIEEGADEYRALLDEWRRLPFETLPDGFDRIEVWRTDRKKDEIYSKFVSVFPRVCTDV